MKKRFLSILLALLMLLSLAACGAKEEASAPAQEAQTNEAPAEAPAVDDKVYTVKVSLAVAEGSPKCEAFYQLADSLKEKSNGRLIMEVFPSNVLGSDEDMIEQAINGANVIIPTDASRLSNYVPDMACFGLGFFIDTYEDALKIIETDVYKGWEESLSKDHDIHLFSFNWYDGPRYAFVNKECKVPADFAGIRMRTGGGSAYFETVSALGAEPVNMPSSETYSAISSKAIDAVEGTADNAFRNRFFEICDYIVLTEHMQLVTVPICGEKWFNTLPEDLQQLLSEGIYEYGKVASELATAASDLAVQNLIDNGMTPIEVDKSVFIEASAQAYENLGLGEVREALYAEIGK